MQSLRIIYNSPNLCACLRQISKHVFACAIVKLNCDETSITLSVILSQTFLFNWRSCTGTVCYILSHYKSRDALSRFNELLSPHFMIIYQKTMTPKDFDRHFCFSSDTKNIFDVDTFRLRIYSQKVEEIKNVFVQRGKKLFEIWRLDGRRIGQAWAPWHKFLLVFDKSKEAQRYTRYQFPTRRMPGLALPRSTAPYHPALPSRLCVSAV